MARRDDPDRDAFGRPVRRRAEPPRATPAPRGPAPRFAPQEHGAGPGGEAAAAPGSPRGDAPVPGSGTWSAPARSGSSPPTAGSPIAPVRSTPSGDATAALLFGIASLVFLPFLLSFPAIVFGRRARRAARDLPGRPGWAAATWGLCLGWFTLIWPVLAFLLLVVGLAAGSDP